MECNCNNNNSNGGVIPWVRGNRLPLIICVYENVVTQEQVGDSTLTVNEMTRVPYTIQDNDTVTVIMKSGFRQVEMPFTTDGNKVMVTDNGELPTGAYTVEVTIERGDGARGRWQETRQVRIYENTSDAQLGEMYSIDADLFFYAKGDTGTGIADIANNPDGTLTITMTDGTSYTTEALKGDKGDKGDTGERGVSIVSFDVTGQTDVSVIYTVTFSDDTTQDIAVPKGPQGDTGLTGNGISSTTLNSDYTLTIAYTDGTTYTTPSIRGAQGAQGVSVIGFTKTGETATNTVYNLVFSDGRTQSVAIPKGTKGDKGDTGNTGAQGAQGPKGDTVTATDYTLYNVQGSDSQGAMSQDATTKAISAQTGYYTCGTISGTAEKVVTVESGNVYKRTLGGHFKVKMTNKNTAASGVTLQIGSETAAALWYNGAAASADNSWEEGEVISVYYDGTYYQASNAQGGGGKAEKIKYDNSQSGLTADNVQEALDVTNVKLTELRGNVYYGKFLDPLTFEAVEDGTFSFSGSNLLYSIDGGSWNELIAGEDTPTITAGSTIAWKTPEDILSTSASIGTFSSSGKYNVLGNIMSLLFTEYVGVVNLYYHTNVFQNLFANGKIVEAKDLQLPATTLSTSCYCSMFEGNQYMVSAPALPALTVTQTCYWKMFKNCASLVSAPALPATTLGVSCYQDMFNGCSSLTIAPELPVISLVIGCYFNMFTYCTSLTSAPVLPAEYLNNYAYGGMFSFCSNLAYVEVYAKSYQAANSVSNILKSVARTGTIVKYEGSPVPTPSGWTTEYITE